MSGELIPVIPVPRFRKAKASVWRDIGVAETDHLLRLSTVDETKAFLLEAFGIQKDSNGRHLIVMDMFYYAVQFCKENDFDGQKTSCVLSILKQTHEMVTETPFGNIRETLEFFKDLILCHSVHRPPFSLGIFSPQEAVAISNYFIDSYFRHFKLYKYIFTPEVQLDLAINYPKFPKTPKDSCSDSKDATSPDDFSKGVTDGSTYPTSHKEADAVQPHSQEMQPTDENREPQVNKADVFDPRLEAIKELKQLILERLSAEMQELQSSVFSQLHQSDEAIGKFVSEAADASKKQAAKKKK